jgi:hypothetical protein
MMVETRQATIIHAAVTLKLIVFGRPGIFPIHVAKNIAQPIKESGHKAVINMKWIRL